MNSLMINGVAFKQSLIEILLLTSIHEQKKGACFEKKINQNMLFLC